MLWGIKYFKMYLDNGLKFKLITDYSALTWLMKNKKPPGRLARWVMYLQAFDFEVLHRKGKAHRKVDALSQPAFMNSRNVSETEDNEDNST